MIPEEVLLLSCVFGASSLVTYFVSNSRRLRPYHLFLGFKIGYAFTCRLAWSRINRLASALMAALSALTVVQWLITKDVLATCSAVMTELIGGLALIVLVSERIAERSLISDPGPSLSDSASPYRGFRVSLTGVLLTAAGLGFLTYALLNLSRVSSGLVPTHFNIRGVPDAYGPPSSIHMLVVIDLMILSTYVLTSYLSVRKPESMYRPWLDRESLRIIVKLTQSGLGLAFLAISASLADVVNYAGSSTHLMPVPLIFALTLTPSAVMVAAALIVLRSYLRWRCGKV